MDISQIKVSETNAKTGIHIGKKEAPVKVISFVNLRCPYCRMWQDKSRDVIAEFIEEGKIELIVKPFDKEKDSLKRGNVTHRYLEYDNPKTALEQIEKIYDTQDEWGSLSFDEVAAYMEGTLGYKEQKNQAASEKIIAEAGNANIVFVPTVIVGENIFDEHIEPKELANLLDKEFEKTKK